MVIIGAGIATIAITYGAATAPVSAAVVGILSGTMSVAGGTAKLISDASGHPEASEVIPTTYFGGTAKLLETAAGDKKHYFSSYLGIAEDVYVWKPGATGDLNTFAGASEYLFSMGATGIDASEAPLPWASKPKPVAKSTDASASSANANAAAGIKHTEPTKLNKAQLQALVKYIKSLPKDKTESK